MAALVLIIIFVGFGLLIGPFGYSFILSSLNLDSSKDPDRGIIRVIDIIIIVVMLTFIVTYIGIGYAESSQELSQAGIYILIVFMACVICVFINRYGNNIDLGSINMGEFGKKFKELFWVNLSGRMSLLFVIITFIGTGMAIKYSANKKMFSNSDKLQDIATVSYIVFGTLVGAFIIGMIAV